MMNIIEAFHDPLLFGPVVKDRTTFKAWFAALKAVFGLPMTEEEANLYRASTGRSELPEGAVGTVWLVIGRRGGKSLVMALIGREAVCREASPTVAIIDSQSVKSAEKAGVRLIRPVMTQERRSKVRSGTFSSILKAC